MNTQVEESIYTRIQEWLEAYKQTSKRVQKKRLENLIVVAMMPIIICRTLRMKYWQKR